MLHLKSLRTASLIRETKIDVWLHFYVFVFYLSLINACIYSFKFIKVLLKHPVFIYC
jgi:hypothetical protein